MRLLRTSNHNLFQPLDIFIVQPHDYNETVKMFFTNEMVFFIGAGQRYNRELVKSLKLYFDRSSRKTRSNYQEKIEKSRSYVHLLRKSTGSKLKSQNKGDPLLGTKVHIYYFFLLLFDLVCPDASFV